MQFLQTVYYSILLVDIISFLCINFSLGTDSFLLTFAHDKCYVLDLSGMVFAMDSYNYNSGV